MWLFKVAMWRKSFPLHWRSQLDENQCALSTKSVLPRSAHASYHIDATKLMPPKRRASQIATSNLFGRAIPEDVEIVESDDEDVLSWSASEEDSDDESPLIAQPHQPQSSSIHERSSTGFVLSSDDAAWRPADGTFPSTLPFTAEPGLQIDASNFTHWELVKVFLTDDIISILVQQTNIYTEQFITSHRLSSKSRVNKWHDTDTNEMWKFIGIIWLMGIIGKPTIESYCTRNRLLSTPAFSNLMSRDCFELILKIFHFNVNSSLPIDRTERKRYMVKPVVDALCYQFETTLTPTQNLSLDESLLKWLGNLGCKVFMPLKRSRYGINVYKLCCEQYTLSFRIYFAYGVN